MSEPSFQLVSQLGPAWPWLTAVERKRRPPSNISPRFAGGSKKKRDIFEDYYMLSWENGEITYVRVQNKDYGLAKIIWTSVVFFLSIYHAVYVAQRELSSSSLHGDEVRDCFNKMAAPFPCCSIFTPGRLPGKQQDYKLLPTGSQDTIQ